MNFKLLFLLSVTLQAICKPIFMNFQHFKIAISYKGKEISLTQVFNTGIKQAMKLQ